jgi:hypothetical protein
MRTGQKWKVAGGNIRAMWFTSIGQAVEGTLPDGEYRVGDKQDVCGRGVGVCLIRKGDGHLFYVAAGSVPGGLKPAKTEM